MKKLIYIALILTLLAGPVAAFNFKIDNQREKQVTYHLHKWIVSDSYTGWHPMAGGELKAGESVRLIENHGEGHYRIEWFERNGRSYKRGMDIDDTLAANDLVIIELVIPEIHIWLERGEK